MLLNYVAAALAALNTLALAQSVELSGKVGPLTTIAAKKAVKTCNITSYGGEAGSDISAALTSAYAACKTGGVVVVPAGNYNLGTWVNMSGGKAWALQLDGIITRTGTAGGNMIFIQHTSDFELFSTTSKGGMQGNGYEIHKTGSLSGARLLRLYQVADFSVHDILLVDAPAFHLTIDTCERGELYNMAIRGGDHGGLDGIDIFSNNIWVHDVMVTNKVSCVICLERVEYHTDVLTRTSALPSSRLPRTSWSRTSTATGPADAPWALLARASPSLISHTETSTLSSRTRW